MDNKYGEGTVVYSIEKPELKMKIKRYIDRVYYCKAHGDPAQKELQFRERELTNVPPFPEEN